MNSDGGEAYVGALNGFVQHITTTAKTTHYWSDVNGGILICE